VKVTSDKAADNISSGRAAREERANAILAARTELMRFRTGTGEDAFPLGALERQRLALSPGTENAPQLVQTWKQDRPISNEQLGRTGDIVGISSLPYANAANLQQPGGRDWRRWHNDQVRYGGGWLIFGVVLTLALFLLWRGRIKIVEGYSGQIIERFNALERANHWLTASAFMLMAFTGLIILYGKPALIPLIGESAFGRVASASAWLHMASTVPFVIGILIMLALWLRDNMPTYLDWEWLKQGGGFLTDDGRNPPARKFNAGQKLVFWGVTLGGLAVLSSGLALMFPFYWFGYDGMQLAQVIHAVIGLCLIALIIGHIYIGTIGMQGAIDAMWRGDVDRNWAREHHKLWYDSITARTQPTDTARSSRPAPAE
jgi:formate dehydrogenase subunit gamma